MLTRDEIYHRARARRVHIVADAAADDSAFADAARFAELDLRVPVRAVPGSGFNAALADATAGVMAPTSTPDGAALVSLDGRLLVHALTAETALAAAVWLAHAGFDPVAMADLPADADRLRKGGLVVRGPGSAVVRDVVMQVGDLPQGAEPMAGVVGGFPRFVARASASTPEAWGDAIAVAAAFG